jgi:hypothetical protein
MRRKRRRRRRRKRSRRRRRRSVERRWSVWGECSGQSRTYSTLKDD